MGCRKVTLNIFWFEQYYISVLISNRKFQKQVHGSNANLSLCCCLEVEKLARTQFLWKIEVHEQKEKVYEMRRWNEALVTNMLPEHVARHFLGSKKRDEVRTSHLLTPLML